MLADDIFVTKGGSEELNRRIFTMQMSKQVCTQLYGDLKIAKQANDTHEITFSFRCVNARLIFNADSFPPIDGGHMLTENSSQNLFRILLVTQSVVDRVAIQILLKSLNLKDHLTIKIDTQEALDHIFQHQNAPDASLEDKLGGFGLIILDLD